jgi:transposase-like protein
VAAVQLTCREAAELCGVRRQSLHRWIKEWKVERLVAASNPTSCLGVQIEKPALAALDAIHRLRPEAASFGTCPT